MKSIFIKKIVYLVLLGTFLCFVSSCQQKEYLGISKVDLMLGYSDTSYPQTTLVVSSTKELKEMALDIENVKYQYRIYYNIDIIDNVYLSLIEITFFSSNPISNIYIILDNNKYNFHIGSIDFIKIDENQKSITSILLQKMVRLNPKQEIVNLRIKNNISKSIIVTDVIIPSNIINPYTTFLVMPELTAVRFMNKLEEITYGDIYINRNNKTLNIETILLIKYLNEGKEYYHYQTLKSSITKENISFLETYNKSLFEVLEY